MANVVTLSGESTQIMTGLVSAMARKRASLSRSASDICRRSVTSRRRVALASSSAAVRERTARWSVVSRSATRKPITAHSPTTTRPPIEPAR